MGSNPSRDATKPTSAIAFLKILLQQIPHNNQRINSLTANVLIGFSIAFKQRHTFQNRCYDGGIRIYPLQAFQHGLFLCCSFAALGFLGTLLMKETYRREAPYPG